MKGFILSGIRLTMVALAAFFTMRLALPYGVLRSQGASSEDAKPQFSLVQWQKELDAVNEKPDHPSFTQSKSKLAQQLVEGDPNIAARMYFGWHAFFESPDSLQSSVCGELIPFAEQIAAAAPETVLRSIASEAYPSVDTPSFATACQSMGFPRAAALVERFGDPQLTRGLVRNWSKVDLAGALHYVESSDTGFHLDSALVESWAESDPAAALAWVRQRNGPPSLIEVIFKIWAKSDLPAAAAAAPSYLTGEDLRDLVRSFARTYPASVAILADDLPPYDPFRTALDDLASEEFAPLRTKQ